MENKIKKYKIPMDELAGKSNLVGSYRISFDINISAEDEIGISDVAQGLAEGFEESPVLNAIANLDIEKLSKEGKILPKLLKVGDLIELTQAITLKAAIFEEDGNYVIGKRHDWSIEVSDSTEITLPEASRAVVNRVYSDKVELVELDTYITASLFDDEIQEVVETPVNVDLISVDLNSVQRVEE